MVCKIWRLCCLMQFDLGQRTHSQGCGSKLEPAAGGDRHRREEEEKKKKPERDRERVSHHYCHSVAHSGHSVSPSVCAGPGRLVGDTLPLLPSISPSLWLLHTYTSTLPLSFTATCCICLCQGDFVMLSSSLLSIAATPASPVILVLASGSGMSSFFLAHSHCPVPGSRTHSCSCTEEPRKTFDIRLEPASWMIDVQNADSSLPGENQYFDLKHNKIYICSVEQRCTQAVQVEDNFALMLLVPLCNVQRVFNSQCFTIC